MRTRTRRTEPARADADESAAVLADARCGSCDVRRLPCARRCGPCRIALLFWRSCGAVLAIARCGSCWRKERNGQTETRPRPYGRGRVFWDGGASGRVFGRTFRGGAADGAMGARRGGARLTGLFSWRGGAVRPAWRLAQAFFAARQAGRWGRGVRRATNRAIFVAGRGAAPGMAAGPSVFCGAAGGAAWRGARPTGVFCGGDGRGVAAIRRALWRPAVGLRHDAAVRLARI